MQNDAWFFLGIFAFIFLIWLATGGPTRPLSLAGPTLSKPQELGGGTYLSFPRSPYTIGSSQKGDNDTSTENSSAKKNSRLFPTFYGISFGNPSPHHGTVDLRSSVSNASSTNANREYVQLTVGKTSSSVVITGWQLVSEITGNYGVIPYGTPLPVLGVVNQLEPIILTSGMRATITTGRSPIGTSFRENKCTGYLNTHQQFAPALAKDCPAPIDELASFYGTYYIRDLDCVDYVKTLSRCETVLYAPRSLSNSCRSFVTQRFTYNGCVAAHKNDPDFAGTHWRIYLGLKESLWRSRTELIKLWDRDRLTVDAISF